jgi:hypothetical protein
MCFVHLAFDTVPKAVVWFCKIRRADLPGDVREMKNECLEKLSCEHAWRSVLYEQLPQTPWCMTTVSMKAPLIRQAVFQISDMFRYFWHT